MCEYVELYICVFYYLCKIFWWDKFKRSFVIVEWYKVIYKNRKIVLVIISCMIIMSSCVNKFVEDRNWKYIFV